MASSKAKVGVNGGSNSAKETKGIPSSPAGEASPNIRIYSLDDLETIATVGECPTCHTHLICPVLGPAPVHVQ